jgi:predicted aspartyl protease
MRRKKNQRDLEKFSLVAFIFLLTVLSLKGEPTQVPFQMCEHLIVTEGSIDGIQGLNLVIDTGATYSVISKPLSKRLRLKTGAVHVVSWGKKVKVRTGQLQEVKIGDATFNSVQIRVANLGTAKNLKIDALIGLDLLKQTSVTIDYEDQVLTLGSGHDLSQQTAFYPYLPYLPIRLQVQDKLLTLVLDTGSPRTVFFEEEISNRVNIIRTRDSERFAHAAGKLRLHKILIEDANIADTRLGTITAFLMNTSGALYGGAAGILSPASLKLRRLCINFETNRISWEI